MNKWCVELETSADLSKLEVIQVALHYMIDKQIMGSIHSGVRMRIWVEAETAESAISMGMLELQRLLLNTFHGGGSET